MMNHQVYMNRRYLFHLLILFILIGNKIHAQTTGTLPIKIANKKFYGLLLDSADIQSVKEKIQHTDWGKLVMDKMLQNAQDYLEHPIKFPVQEGGWIAQYIDSTTGKQLIYDINSPTVHWTDDGKRKFTGAVYDRAWSDYTILALANRMYLLATMSLITKQSKYAEGLKRMFLDLADKYSHYRIHDRSFNVYGEGAGAIAGRAMSQSIDECNFLSQIIFSYDALLQSGILTAGESKEINEKLWANARKLLYRILRLHPSGGNWWMWHSCGAMAVGLATHDDTLIDMALNNKVYGAVQQLKRGYLNGDGLVEENSTTYQGYAMMAISRMALMSKRLNIPFYKIPNVQKSFSVLVNLGYPNLTLPRINDSRHYSLIDVDTSITANYSPLDLLNIAWTIYHAPDIKNDLSRIYASAGRQDEKIKSFSNIYTLLYGPKDVGQPTGNNFPSFVSKDSGLALLRSFSGKRDWCLLFKNTNPAAGHAHLNDLHISGYANGDEFIASFGSSEYSHYSYQKWYVQSLASNTVVINALSQNKTKARNYLNWTVTSGPFKAVRGSSENVRNTALDSKPPLRFTRTVIITPMAFYDFFHVLSGASFNKGSNNAMDTIDYVLHFNDSIHWNGQLTDITGALSPSPTHKGNNNDPYVPYHLLSSIREIKSRTSNLSGTIIQPDAGKVHSVFFHADNQKEYLYAAMGLGYEDNPNKRTPMLIKRIIDSSAGFSALFIPYKQKDPYIRSDVLLNNKIANVISLCTNGGNETLFESVDNKVIVVNDPLNGKSVFQGDIGVIEESKNKDQPVKSYFLLGKTLQDTSGAIQLSDSGIPVTVTIYKDSIIAYNYGIRKVDITWTPKNGKTKYLSLQPSNSPDAGTQKDKKFSP